MSSMSCLRYVRRLPLVVAAAFALQGCDGGGYGGDRRDMTAPTVTLNTGPATVSRQVALAATATDNRGVAQVEFLVDGNVVGTDTTAPYAFGWNSGLAADGSHSVAARATDAAGNVTTSAAVTIVVQNSMTFNVVLSGAEEVPAVTTPATGTASLSVNIGTGSIAGTIALSGMTATAAHVHDGFAGQSGPVAIGLTEIPSTPGTWELPLNAALTAAQVDRLLAGALYLNAHSSAHPAGEVRGQIVPSNIVIGFARLEGLQEVPEVVTTASAQGAVTVDRDAGNATVHLTTRGVLSPTAAHLHEAVGGRNGPVLIGLTQDGSDPLHWSAAGQPITPAALAALEAGATYLNVHTTANPGGEVRGQVTTPAVMFVAARLAGDQEVPATATAARGTVALTVDRGTRAYTLHANASGVDDATAGHIHDAYAGANGAVAVPLTKDPADVTHWSASGAQFTADQFAALSRGRLYVNVHTPANPAGEIRGQLIPDNVVLVFSELTGAQEVPPVATTASGHAATTVDLLAQTVTIHVRSAGVDAATAAHIHRAAPGTSGPVIVPLVMDAAGPGQWAAIEQPVDTVQLNDFLAGLWYVNLHTPTHPTGEIRAQIERELPPAPDTNPPPAAATLSQLQSTIFSPRCSGCHTGGGAVLPASMNLSSAAASFAALVNVSSAEQPALRRVLPGDAAASYLVRKLEGSAGITGERMPQGGPFLSAAEIDRVRSWINAGAPNN